MDSRTLIKAGKGQLAFAPEGARELGVSRSCRELIRVDVVAQLLQNFLQGVSASCRCSSDIKCEGSPENQALSRPGGLSSVDGLKMSVMRSHWAGRVGVVGFVYTLSAN
jgi:hypothetical protein